MGDEKALRLETVTVQVVGTGPLACGREWFLGINEVLPDGRYAIRGDEPLLSQWARDFIRDYRRGDG